MGNAIERGGEALCGGVTDGVNINPNVVYVMGGRIYGVVNMPEEVVGAAPQVQQAYVLQQINKWGPLTIEMGLADIIYPEIERITGTASYLVIMWPQYDAFSFWPIIFNIFRTILVGFGLFLLGRVIWNNFHYISDLFNRLLELAGL